MILSRIKKKVIEVETRPVVLHEIPGRVRFGIKVFKRLTKDMLPLVDHLKAIIEEIPSVNEIKVNNISGSLLVSFDKDKTDSKKVQAFIRDVVRYLLSYSDSILSVKDENLPQVLEELSLHVKGLTKEDLSFTPDEVPDSIWKK